MRIPTINVSWIDLKRRRAVFAAVVEAQDKGYSVKEAREIVAEKFNLETWDVASVEAEGVEHGWPPLD